MKTSHGKCGKTWTQRGNSTSHCGGCHETFATLTLFDAHRKGESAQRECQPPTDDLIQDDEGVWCTLEGLLNREASAKRLAAFRAGMAKSDSTV